jgi:hypothetical protein
VSTDRHHASDQNTKARACDAEHAAVWRRAVTEFASPPATFWPASGADPVLSCSPPLPCRPSSSRPPRSGIAGTNSVTYTDASPTLPELWLLLAQQAVSKVGSAGKFGNAEAVVVALAIHSHWPFSVGFQEPAAVVEPRIRPEQRSFSCPVMARLV